MILDVQERTQKRKTQRVILFGLKVVVKALYDINNNYFDHIADFFFPGDAEADVDGEID